MFLNESYSGSIDMNDVQGTLEPTLENAHMINYEMSEYYHGLVESMIIAEHTAIVNEDANLLSEASTGFFKKIADGFRWLGKKIKEMWQSFVRWFKMKIGDAKEWVKANQTKIIDGIKGKKVTIKGYEYANDPYAMSCVTDVLKRSQAQVKTYIAAGRKVNEGWTTKDNSDAVLKKVFGGDYVDNKDRWAEDLKAEIRGSKEKKEVVLNESRIRDAIKYVTNYDLSKAEKSYRETAKLYDDLAKFFDSLAGQIGAGQKNLTAIKKVSDGDIYEKTVKSTTTEAKASTGSEYFSRLASQCRSISTGINSVIGIASSCSKERYSMYVAFCKKAKGGRAADATAVSESASILDMFAL